MTASNPPGSVPIDAVLTKERLEQALDASGAAVWDADLATGCVYLSRNWAAMLGSEPRATVTTVEALKELVHPDDVENLIRLQAEVIRGLRPHYAAEHRVRTAGGAWKWILSRGRVSARDPATGRSLRMSGTNFDVTELKRLEEEVTRAEEEKQRILDSVPAEIAYIDRSERVVFANRMYLDQRNLTSRETAGRSLREVVGEERYAGIWSRAALALAGYPVEFELREKSPRGVMRELSVRYVPDTAKDGLVRGFFYLAIDVTDRKRVEHALAESEERFRGLTRLSSDWYWEQDAQYRFTYVSEGLREHFGLDPARLLGQSWHDEADVRPVQGSWEGFRAQLEARKPFRDVLLQHEAPDGRLRYARISGEPVIGEDGSPLGYRGVGRNVTAQVRAELELKAAKLTAENANRAKSDFLSNMSHELRTPLGAILGFGQLLEEDVAALPTALHRQWVGSIVRAGWHLLGLVNEVLDLARIEAGRIELSLDGVSLDDLVDECRGEIAALAAKREIKVTTELDGTPYARADRMRLRQVLLNLLSNAVKYNRDGGEVRVSVRPAGNVVRIAVSDTGQGIAKERMAELFQPFKRLGAERSKVEGFGLGLSITRRLIEMMGGRIEVESEPGRGSTFWFELPLERAEESAAAAAPSAETGDGLKSLAATVLCVEDDPANQRLIQAVFSRWKGMRLILAQDGKQGLDLALNGRPDLILLDIDLPGINGYDILRVLREREHTKHIPVIGVSARAMPADMDRAVGASFHTYLTKPYQLRELHAAIESALASIQRPA
jgi:PAS domain S-box-containing protein